MSKREDYEKKAENLLIPIVEELGIRIYDVEYVKEGKDYYLRAYIDKDGGVNIIDCETVSRAFSELLDREDFISDAYILEVSSPGLGRSLKKDRHLSQSIGLSVDIKFYKPMELDPESPAKVKETTGILRSFDRDQIVLTPADSEGEPIPGAGDLSLQRKDIASMSLTLIL